MANNKNPRFNTQSQESFIGDFWAKQFQESLNKVSVQVSHEEDNIHDQINAIMNGKKAKYQSVQAAVEDMQQRSGYKDFLNKKAQSVPQNQNIVKEQKIEESKTNSQIPQLLQKHPNIKQTIDNYIKSTRGNISIPAILHKLKSIHQKEVVDKEDWEDKDFISYIAKENLKAKSENPETFSNYSNLGKEEHVKEEEIDSANTDFFSALNPAKY